MSRHLRTVYNSIIFRVNRKKNIVTHNRISMCTSTHYVGDLSSFVCLTYKKLISVDTFCRSCRTERIKNHRVPNCHSLNCLSMIIHPIRNWLSIWIETTGSRVKQRNHRLAHRHRVQWLNHLTLFHWRFVMFFFRFTFIDAYNYVKHMTRKFRWKNWFSI